MDCPHCNTKLSETYEKEKMSYRYECKHCQCIFRTTIVHWEPKCYAKFHKHDYDDLPQKKVRKVKKEVEDGD